ncbi:MAG TPA: helix-turn-helix transcriptional regulator [Verrucomicrobiae bacterium]|jgi:transcriptional regulator with XRE-family HTH domain|nr:helix-turn-helix transcriptional regulator [Verrucomicrobiae bacterium]
MSPKRFAVRLRTIRTRRGMTQEALATKVGVSRAYLARLEMGRHDPPLSRLRKLAKALGASVAELVG